MTGSRAPIPIAFVLPALFLIIVTPIAVFVASGAGTHMSPLMLYPFASPWWIFDRESVREAEIRMLLAGCGVNAVLLAFAGMLVDRWRQRRRPLRARRDGQA